MRRRQGLSVGVLLCAALLAGPRPASAISLGDRIDVHGFYELQTRGIARDFDGSDDWDLTQLAHVLNLEIEAALVEESWGPIDLATLFVRVEVRYDCVWTRACGLFPSVNAYGDGAKKLPKRLNDGRRDGYSGTLFIGDMRRYRGEPVETFRLPFANRPKDSRRPYGIDRTQAFSTNFLSAGPDQILGSADDPAPFFFDRYYYGSNGRCKFSSRRTKGFTDGQGISNLGPFDPACEVESIAAFADKPNPFREGDFNELYGVGGSLALPYRPAPEAGFRSLASDDTPRGLWIPNARLAERIRDGKFDNPDINFRQDELAWNHGGSQDERELKEAYLDIEMLDSRLWLRIGKQTIVWGKTELFRSQDQFNPQDLALSSLPGLEESRVALWSARAVYSFWEVGPFEDVRIEAAVNFDQYEPNDLGTCGEPYAVILICAGSFGFLAHGFEGVGIAGVQRPPDPWNDVHGLEGGVRLEWRWDRFSFAVTDFYGFSDLPYVEQIFRFERNVDPLTGRPRRLNERGRCRTGREAACLGPGADALANHSVNQTMFAKNCAATFGFVSLDPSACGPSLFNSQVETEPGNPVAPRLMIALSNVFSGQCTELGLNGGIFSAGCGILEGIGAYTSKTFAELGKFPWALRTPISGTAFPLVPLVADPADGGPNDPGQFAGEGWVPFFVPTGLAPFLTDEQEALLGCGPIYGTGCDIDGMDILNAEASALFQSWPGFEGTAGDWNTTAGSLAQPGTRDFRGGPVCTRYERGKIFVLPGCRGAGDAGYDIRKDGSTGGGVHPFTGQPWNTEMAIYSWNLLVALTTFAIPADPSDIQVDEFDANDPFRKNACSYAQPQFCNTISDFWKPIRTKRNTIRAGGNGRYGRRDFQWQDGTPLAIRYEKRNVLGFSMDFAEDVTKSNWSFELTWFEDTPYGDNDEFDGIRKVDAYNLVVSMDRPTFVNFLNANRTFFINTQWFIQYIDGHRKGFTANGPWNVLATFTVNTGYFQDRLLPQMTLVYDFQSNSGAVLPQISYRFNSNFQATFGLAIFYGRFEAKTAPVNPVASLNRVGRHANRDFVENGLSLLRANDEAFLSIRYTF